MIRLSIIIPYFNTGDYTKELLEVLEPQITKDVEVCLVDDGSITPFKTHYTWVNVIRQDNKGCSTARNVGIENTSGEYISFLDSDDLVASDFIAQVLEKIKDGADVIELSWKSIPGKGYQCDCKLNSINDRLTNPSVCTRVFKRAFIGDTRFSVKKDSTEDEDFSRKIGYLDPETEFKRDVITDYMYFYRTYVENSKTKKYANGLMNTKRVYYYYDKVTESMEWLRDEIIKDDEYNEVFLMTNECQLKGLARYCKIVKPSKAWAHIIKGDKTDLIEQRKPPVKTQVVIYRKIIPRIGGLSAFIDNFIALMSDKYDITIAADTINEKRYFEWGKKVRVVASKIKNVMRSPSIRNAPIDPNFSLNIVCDTLIALSFLDAIPGNIQAKKTIRMVHACKTEPDWFIPHDSDEVLYVSKTAMESYGVKDGHVLHNLINISNDRALILVSATRLPAPDKGKIEERMYWLANELNNKGIKYIWLNFADGELTDPPANFYNMGISDNMQEIFKAADYCVQLSDSECWPYSCLEALLNGCAILCTEFPATKEMGIIDGVNGYIIPFNLDFDVTKLTNVPKFKYEYDNNRIIKEWIKILGKSKPKHDYVPPIDVLVRIESDYLDMRLGMEVTRGQLYYMPEPRAKELKELGLVAILEG